MKRVKRNNLTVFILVVLITTPCFFISCNNNFIDEETAVKVYVEKLIAEESYSFSADSVQIHIQKVFSKYNTTWQEFEGYLRSLEDQPKKLESFFKRSDEYLLELNKKGIVK